MSRLAPRIVPSVAVGMVRLGLLGLLVLAGAGAGCVDSKRTESSGSRERAPDFSLTRLDGQPVHLADYQGRPVILDFWATWCAPCEVQMPVLETLWKNLGGKDLMILGISVDTDPAADVVAWVEKRAFTYPIAIASQELAIDYGVIGFPTLVVLDPEGSIHTRHVGVLSRPELEEILEEIAREPPAAVQSAP